MNWRNALVSEQQRKCDQFKSPFVASPPELKIGISLSARQGLVPVNGLRHPPASDTTGWRLLIAGGHEDVWYDETLLAPDLAPDDDA